MVQDRMIQQAIAQVLNKIFEPTFSESSFGFRPNRGARNAIRQSETYINQGHKWIRRRLRACLWKQWKKTKTKYKNLIKLGISKSKAYQFANTRKGYCRISNSPILHVALNNGYFKYIGLMSLSNIYQIIN